MEHQERHKRLLKLLDEHGSASVAQFAQWLDVSASTVRRDLRLLGTSGQIERVHGGGRRAEARGSGALRGGSFHSERLRHPERKRAIARFAASLCQDGETVLIGGGTTTGYMTEFLVNHRMRILTNSFEAARALLHTSDNEVILSGGKVYANQGIVLSPFDSEAIQYCYGDKLFLGAYGLTTLGLMESDPLLIQAGRRLIHQARQLIVLADSSKFENRGGMFLCGLEQIATVITDEAVSDAAAQIFERAGVALKVVASAPGPDAAACFAPARSRGVAPAMVRR